MGTIVSQDEYRGYTVKWEYDNDGCIDSPREWCNVATFVCQHRDYQLGDRQDLETCVDELFSKYVTGKQILDYFIQSYGAKWEDGEEDDQCELYLTWVVESRYCGEINHSIGFDKDYTDDDLFNELCDELGTEEKLHLVEETGEVVLSSISMYEHSGITIWLGGTFGHPDAQWDCSNIGFAYIEKSTAEKKQILKTLPNKDFKTWQEWAWAMMESEMKVYDDYVRGNVYFYQIEDENGDVIDSCGGYIGDDAMKEQESEIHAIIDQHIEAESKRKTDELHTVVGNLGSIAGQMFVYGLEIVKIGKDMFGNDCVELAKVTKHRVGVFVPVSVSELDDDTVSMLSNKIKEAV